MLVHQRVYLQNPSKPARRNSTTTSTHPRNTLSLIILIFSAIACTNSLFGVLGPLGISDLRAPMFHGRIIWQWIMDWKNQLWIVPLGCCTPPSSVWSFAPPSPPYARARNGHGCYSNDLIWELYPHVCVWNPRNDFGVLWLFSSFLALCPLQTSSIFIFFIFPSPPSKKIRSNPTPPPARRPLGALISEANLASRIMTSTCCPMSRAMSWWKSWIGMGMGIAWTTLGNFVNWWTNRWNILVTHVYRWWISFRMVDFSLKTSLNTALNETLVGKSIHFGVPHRVF